MFIDADIYPSLVLPVVFQDQNKSEQVIKTYQVPETKDKDAVFDELLVKIEGESNSRKRVQKLVSGPSYRLVISAAASVIVIFLLHLFISEKTVENTFAENTAFRLPDNSRVVLSENSTVGYSPYWWKREVKLQGEAYFEVEKGEKFTVKTPAGKISVLGTRFQVSEVEDGLIVKCFEGKVKLSNKETEQIVEAGNALAYRPGNMAELAPLHIEYPQLAYFNGTFSKENLTKVLTELETFFNVRIQTGSPTERYFSGKLETANAETAVRIICRSLNLDYTFITKDQIIINERKK